MLHHFLYHLTAARTAKPLSFRKFLSYLRTRLVLLAFRSTCINYLLTARCFGLFRLCSFPASHSVKPPVLRKITYTSLLAPFQCNTCAIAVIVPTIAQTSCYVPLY